MSSASKTTSDEEPEMPRKLLIVSGHQDCLFNQQGEERDGHVPVLPGDARKYHSLHGSSHLSEWLSIHDSTEHPAMTAIRSKFLLQRADICASVRQFVVVQSWESSNGPEAAASESGTRVFGTVLVVLLLRLQPNRDGSDLERWYDEEHMPMIRKVKGWVRTILCKPDEEQLAEDRGEEYLTLHEYESDNGLQSPQFKEAINTPRAREMQDQATESLTRRVYSLQ